MRNLAVQRGYGSFNGSTQYLSVASPGAGVLWTGGTGWAAGWIRATDFNAERAIISTRSGNSGYYPAVTTGGLLTTRLGTGSSLGQVTNSAVMRPGNWYFWYMEYDGTTHRNYVNAANEAPLAQVFSPTAGNFTLGSRTNPDQYWSGDQSNVIVGTTPVAAIRTRLYNGGQYLPFSEITAAERTAWGVVSGWLGSSATADDIGSNTLTNNGSVQFMPPAGRQLAYTTSLVSSAAVDSTGLVLTVTGNAAFTVGSGLPQLLVDSLPAVLAYKDKPSTTTVRYDITNGNPSGNPLLTGAVATLVANRGTWLVGGVPNTAFSGTAVTNSSTATVIEWIPSPSYCFKDAAKTQPCADGEQIYTFADRYGLGRDLVQSNSAFRPTLRLSSGKWCARFVQGVGYMHCATGLGGTAATDRTIGAALLPTNANSNVQIFDLSSAFDIYSTTGGSTTGYGWYDVAWRTSNVPQTLVNQVVVWQPNAGIIRKDGAVLTSSLTYTPGVRAMDIVTLGASHTFGDRAGFDLYGTRLIPSTLTGPTLDNFEAYLRRLMP